MIGGWPSGCAPTTSGARSPPPPAPPEEKPPMSEAPLTGYRIVDLSSEIAGAYAMRLLADGGADVVKVEDPAGDPLRRWSASGQQLGDDDGALFRYLHGGHRSV